jgi:hypothetical protein
MAALTKVHVECGVVVDMGNASLFYGLWSETINVGASTSKSATDSSTGLTRKTSQLVFRVRAPTATEIYGAEGQSPDATLDTSIPEENNRGHLAAGELRDFPTKPGAKFATATVS